MQIKDLQSAYLFLLVGFSLLDGTRWCESGLYLTQQADTRRLLTSQTLKPERSRLVALRRITLSIARLLEGAKNLLQHDSDEYSVGFASLAPSFYP